MSKTSADTTLTYTVDEDPALWAQDKTAAEIYDVITARRTAKRRAGIMELDKVDTILEWCWAERSRAERESPAEAAGRPTERETAALGVARDEWMALRAVTELRGREVTTLRQALGVAWSLQVKRSIMGKVTERPKGTAAEREALGAKLTAAREALEDARRSEHEAQRRYNRLNRGLAGVARARRTGVQVALDIAGFLAGKRERGQEVDEKARRESWSRAGGQEDTTIRIGADGAEIIP